MKLLAAFLLALALPTGALAGESGTCPWGPGMRVFSNMTQVTVGRTVYAVRRKDDRKYFEDLLLACGMPEVRDAFRGWRGARIGVNATAGISTLLLIPPVTAAGAVGWGAVFPSVAIAAGIARTTTMTRLRRALEVLEPPPEAPSAPPPVRRERLSCESLASAWHTGTREAELRGVVARAPESESLGGCLDGLVAPWAPWEADAATVEAREQAWSAVALSDDERAELAAIYGDLDQARRMLDARARAEVGFTAAVLAWGAVDELRSVGAAAARETALTRELDALFDAVDGRRAEVLVLAEVARTSPDGAAVVEAVERIEGHGAALRAAAGHGRTVALQVAEQNERFEAERAALEGERVLGRQQVTAGNAMMVVGAGLVAGAGLAAAYQAAEDPRHFPADASDIVPSAVFGAAGLTIGGGGYAVATSGVRRLQKAGNGLAVD